MAGGKAVVVASQSANAMQRPCWSSEGTHNVTAHCNLLQQLSQDLLDTAPADLNTGCDSSDCLLCQGQRQFCNQAITNSVCSWLGRRRSSSFLAPVCSSRLSGAGPQPAADQPCLSCRAADQPQQQGPAQLECAHLTQQHKRPRLSPDNTPASSTAASPAEASSLGQGSEDSGQQLTYPSLSHQQQQEQGAGPQQAAGSGSCCGGPLLGGLAWQWQPEFDALEGPAPAQLTEVAQLQSAADASSGHCAGRCDRICGLEFSPDGLLLAAAGVSKQIGLYPLAALAQLQEAPAEVTCAVPGCLSSCSSHQRQQRQQQRLPQPHVPLLVPVATVRLPGKVSSIAFSPDLQGVISIGDYDGTLTQVHVASGHYLNEVDAHAGRRIWSVCHSRLLCHFAVTASDDCTARLWSGPGLNTLAATISAPGRPAVCGADFSSTHEQLLALAAADAKVYLYDLRQLRAPVAVLQGHRRPVSYAKFFGSQHLVSASIDGSLAVWDLAAALGWASEQAEADTAAAGWPGAAAGAPAPSPSPASSGVVSGEVVGPGERLLRSSEGRCSSAGAQGSCEQDGVQAAASAHSGLQQQQQPWKVFRGHKNEKNFVGLAVEPCSGLMAVGSETSDVFSYHTSWSSPLATFDMAAQTSSVMQPQPQPCSSVRAQMQLPAAATWQSHQPLPQQQPSVSAVAWQPSCAAAAVRVSSGRCGPATLLAAATSTGACKLLGLLQA